ncbi:MAG: hypothetical protein IKZ72_03180 [Bacteroidales bacterium]|nr:hypothetical protein [Bacteroidales bacterium]
MNQCKDCRFYKMTYDGPYCHKNPRPVPVSPISSKDCFEEPVPVQGPAAPVNTSGESQAVQKPKRKGGRPRSHQNYVDGNGVTMKWCRMCQQYKPLDEFYHKSGTPDGHAYECKKCRTEHQRKKREENRNGKPARRRTKSIPLPPDMVIVNNLTEQPPVIGDFVFRVPMSLFAGKVEVVFRPENEFMNVEIRRK